jgi:hypothetical protein
MKGITNLFFKSKGEQAKSTAMYRSSRMFRSPTRNLISAKRKNRLIWGGAGRAHKHLATDSEGNPIPDTLWYDREQPLSDIYPISIRFVLKKTFLSLCIMMVVMGAYVSMVPRENLLSPQTFNEKLYFWVIRISIMFTILQVAYWELYRRTLEFGTDGFRLLISKGVLRKKIGSIPLIPVTELVIYHDNLDVLLGLHQVHVLAPVDSGDKLGILEGFSKDNAMELERFLAAQLNNQIFIPDVSNR